MTPTTSAHPDAAVKQMCGSLSGAQGALGWGRLWETSRTPETPCAPIPTVLGPAFPLKGLHRSFPLHTAGPCKPSLHWLPTSLPLPQQGLGLRPILSPVAHLFFWRFHSSGAFCHTMQSVLWKQKTLFIPDPCSSLPEVDDISVQPQGIVSMLKMTATSER